MGGLPSFFEQRAEEDLRDFPDNKKRGRTAHTLVGAVGVYVCAEGGGRVCRPGGKEQQQEYPQ